LQQQLGNNGSTGISLTVMTQQPMSPTCLFYCQGQQQAQPNIEETGMLLEISKEPRASFNA